MAALQAQTGLRQSCLAQYMFMKIIPYNKSWHKLWLGKRSILLIEQNLAAGWPGGHAASLWKGVLLKALFKCPWARHCIPTSYRDTALWLTLHCDLSVELASQKRISLHASIKFHIILGCSVIKYNGGHQQCCLSFNKCALRDLQ